MVRNDRPSSHGSNQQTQAPGEPLKPASPANTQCMYCTYHCIRDTQQIDNMGYNTQLVTHDAKHEDRQPLTISRSFSVGLASFFSSTGLSKPHLFLLDSSAQLINCSVFCCVFLCLSIGHLRASVFSVFCCLLETGRNVLFTKCAPNIMKLLLRSAAASLCCLAAAAATFRADDFALPTPKLSAERSGPALGFKPNIIFILTGALEYTGLVFVPSRLPTARYSVVCLRERLPELPLHST